jgi:cytochrome P450
MNGIDRDDRSMIDGSIYDDRLHEELAAAASRGPTAVDANTGALTVLRHHDVDVLAHDRRLEGLGLSVFDMLGIGDGPLRSWYGQLMFTTEGDTHGRLRRLVQIAFTPRSVERLRSDVAEQVRLRTDRLIADGGGDLIDTFSRLPTWTMCQLIGVPSDDVAQFGEWLDALSPVFGFMDPEQIDAASAAIVQLSEYVGRLVDDRRTTPGDTLVDDLIAASEEGERLDREELVAMVANLLVGGHDTTESQLWCTLLTLLRHEAELNRLRSDPSLVPSAVSEAMRFEPAITVIPRTVPVALELLDAHVASGAFVMLSTAAANRDPAVWDRPDDLDISRFSAPGAAKLLSFGAGPHYCLGANLARLTLEEAVGGIRAVDGLRPAADPWQVAWTQVLGRAPVELPVVVS